MCNFKSKIMHNYQSLQYKTYYMNILAVANLETVILLTPNILPIAL